MTVAEIAAPAAAAGPSSHADIFRSTAWIGGSALITVLIGIVRTKVVAVLLGPAGFGLMGLYTSIADLVRSTAELGINSSGVRQIAAAAGSGDTARIALTVTVLRRVALVLGLLGAAILLLLAAPISTLTFGSTAHAGALALLSLAVFLRLVADGQGALLQGLRRIADLARMNVYGALGGAVVSVPIVYVLREDGVVPALIAVAGMSLLLSWHYSRRVRVDPVRASTRDVVREATPLLKLGLAFMASGMLTMAAAYAVRLIVIRQHGLEAAGLFQAAWTLGGLYVGFVLQAMGADFYPRLVAAAANDAEVNRLVNEQAQVSLLLAGAGIVATLTLAPWVVRLFYSAHFDGAVDALRWICLGMALRVVSWPVGFIVIAKARQGYFFAAELAWALANVGLTWIGVQWWGVAGAGIGFAASYAFHVLLVLALGRRLSGFAWTAENRRTLWAGALLIAAVQAGFSLLPTLPATVLGGLAFVASAVYSLHALRRLIGTVALPRRLQWMAQPMPWKRARP